MNHKYHVFVTEYLKWGNQVLAYRNAYKTNSSHKSVQSAANRLLNHPEVAKAIYEAEARIRGEVEIAIANRQIKEVLTIEEKRSLLKQIATGSIYIEQKYKGKNCTQCSQYITSTIKEMLWAIREDSKTAGHYPYKLNGKWIIPAAGVEEEINTSLSSTENNTDSVSRPFRGIGGEPAQDENTNPENLPVRTDVYQGGQQNTCPNDEIGRATTERSDLNETNRKDPSDHVIRAGINYELTEEQKETETPLLFLGGDIGASASGGCERQSGWLTREEQETPNENLQQFTTTERSDVDNQPITEDPETHNTPTVTPSGRILTRAELKELLHPSPKPKLMPMVNEQHE